MTLRELWFDLMHENIYSITEPWGQSRDMVHTRPEKIQVLLSHRIFQSNISTPQFGGTPKLNSAPTFVPTEPSLQLHFPDLLAPLQLTESAASDEGKDSMHPMSPHGNVPSSKPVSIQLHCEAFPALWDPGRPRLCLLFSRSLLF